MCAKITCKSGDSAKLLLSQRAWKCIAKTGLTNEFKIAAIGAPVRNDGCVNLSDIWHLDCKCGLRNYSFVLLTQWTNDCRFHASYTCSKVFLHICTSKMLSKRVGFRRCRVECMQTWYVSFNHKILVTCFPVYMFSWVMCSYRGPLNIIVIRFYCTMFTCTLVNTSNPLTFESPKRQNVLVLYKWTSSTYHKSVHDAPILCYCGKQKSMGIL